MGIYLKNQVREALDLKVTILNNSIWMMLEKLISIFGIVFVSSYVAKYVGTSIFGTIALSISVCQIILVISQMGSDVIIFKRASKNEFSGVVLIEVTKIIRMSIYFALSIPLLVYYYHDDAFIYVLAACIACFFQSMDVYSVYYEALLRAIINTFVNISGIIISLLLRWVIAYYKMDPHWLFIPIVLATMIPYIVRTCRFKFFDAKKFNTRKISAVTRGKYKRYLLVAGSSFAISTICIIIYSKLSLLIVGGVDGHRQAAIYSVSVTLSTSWSFVLYSFITSFLPSIFSEKSQVIAMKKTAKLNLFVLSVSFFCLVCIYIVSPYFIKYFYGNDYVESFVPLMILSLSTVVSALGVVSTRFIAKYSGYSYLSKKTIIVLVLSLLINYLFILKFGIVGAAWATLLTEVLSLTVFNYFFMNKLILRLHLSTFCISNK